MILDLTRLLSGEVSKIEVSFELDTDSSEDIITALDTVSFTSKARVKGAVTDNAGYMRLSLEVSLDYLGECARCLGEVRDTLSFFFERTVVSEDTLSRDFEGDDGEYSDEYAVLHDGMLDVDRQLCEMLILEFPSKLLCKEECLGLCIKCGHNLNEGDCGCDRSFRDPRWNKLLGVKFSADADRDE